MLWVSNSFQSDIFSDNIYVCYHVEKNLKSVSESNIITVCIITLGGPIIIPVQCVRVMSSSFSSPQLIVPSPTPFCPCSSSSSRRKLRGTTAKEQSFYNIYRFYHNTQLAHTDTLHEQIQMHSAIRNFKRKNVWSVEVQLTEQLANSSGLLSGFPNNELLCNKNVCNLR